MQEIVVVRHLLNEWECETCEIRRPGEIKQIADEAAAHVIGFGHPVVIREGRVTLLTRKEVP